MKIIVMKTAIVNMVRLLCAGLTVGACMVSADTVVFIKPDSADWTLPENQDRITSSVWILGRLISPFKKTCSNMGCFW